MVCLLLVIIYRSVLLETIGPEELSQLFERNTVPPFSPNGQHTGFLCAPDLGPKPGSAAGFDKGGARHLAEAVAQHAEDREGAASGGDQGGEGSLTEQKGTHLHSPPQLRKQCCNSTVGSRRRWADCIIPDTKGDQSSLPLCVEWLVKTNLMVKIHLKTWTRLPLSNCTLCCAAPA
jgi:hypothetical protein